MNISDVKPIFDRLITARERAGMSQMEVARLMGLSSSSTISHYESRARDLSVIDLLRLCEIYNISIVWVLTGVMPDVQPDMIVGKAKLAANVLRQLADTLEQMGLDIVG